MILKGEGTNKKSSKKLIIYHISYIMYHISFHSIATEDLELTGSQIRVVSHVCCD